MLIGEDYPKIEFSLFGMDLLEPNSLIGNTLILLTSLWCIYKTGKFSDGSPFFKYWKWFYLLSGISFFIGGLSHAFFIQWGVPGKYLSWIMGIVSVAFIELAMVTIYPDFHTRNFMNKLIFAKLLLAITAEFLVIQFIDLSMEPARGIIVPTINSVIGMGIALGGTGYYYQQKIDPAFKYLWISALVLIPITAIQVLKFNPHPWFDRNDLSHLLLIIGCFLYLKTIRGYAVTLEIQQLNSYEGRPEVESLGARAKLLESVD